MTKNKIKYILILIGIVSTVSIISVSAFFGAKSCSKSKKSIENMTKKPIIEKNKLDTKKPQDSIKLSEEIENLKIASNNLEKVIEKSIKWKAHASIKNLNIEAKEIIKSNKDLINLSTKKIEDISKQISQTNLFIKQINDEILLIKSNDLKFLNNELKTELVSQKNKLIENEENKKVAIVKNEIKTLNDLVINIETNINDIENDYEKLSIAKKNLTDASNSLDKVLWKMNENVEMFIKEFPNNVKFVNKDNVERVDDFFWNDYADNQQKEHFLVSEKFKIDDLTYDYDIDPLRPYGIVMFELKIKYGKISKSVLVNSNEKFIQLSDEAFRGLYWDFFREPYSALYTSNWQGFATKKKSDLENTIIKLEEILDKKITPITDENKAVLNDAVATFLWSYDYVKSNDKQKSLEKIKTEFINKKEDENFSKLEYLVYDNDSSSPVKWNEIINFAMLISFANGHGKNNVNFEEFRGQLFVNFIKKWFDDYISKYFSITTKKVGDGKLYEIFQPKRTLDMAIALKNIVDKSQLHKAYEIAKNFSKSISKYGVSEDSTNPIEQARLFSTRQFLALENYDGNIVYQDAKDFKYWLENTDYEKLYQELNGNLKSIRRSLWWFRQMISIYTKIKEHNLELGLSNTNFMKLQNWVLNTLIVDLKLATFENMNKSYGELWMETIAEVYLIMGINPDAQREFIRKLKTSPLLKNRKKTDFEKHDSMSFDTKDVWNLFF